MTFNMTLPMVLWMRHRGHTWERGGEMAAAMIVVMLYRIDECVGHPHRPAGTG